MRRLDTFFVNASPLVNTLYWLSLWWMGMIAGALGSFLILARSMGGEEWRTLLDILPIGSASGALAIPSPETRRMFMIGSFATAFCWLALVGWAAQRMEKRIGAAPTEPETRFLREEAERRGIRWMLRISVGAAWLIPTGAAFALSWL